MTVYIDADGCPVVKEAVMLCRKSGAECTIICDTSHIFNIEGVRTITVEKGADSADMKLVNMVCAGDIAITQDYGLAAMCLAKKARVINQDGIEYTDLNIDAMLYSRYESKKIRMAGGRLKGPKKRSSEQTEAFVNKLRLMLE